MERVGFDFVKAAKTGNTARSSVGTFLNRLLGLRLSQQNALFEVFAKLVDHAVRKARREKKFDEAIKEIDGRRVEITDETVVVEATDDKPALVHLCVEVDRGITFDDAVARLAEAKKDATAAAPSTRLGAIRERIIRVLHQQEPVAHHEEAPGHDGPAVAVARARRVVARPAHLPPQDGRRPDAAYRRPAALRAHRPRERQGGRGAEYVDPNCSHGAKCKNKKTCEVGKRVQHKHLLCGSLLDSMRKAEGIIARRYASSGHCNVCRVIEKKNDEPTDGGRRALGLEIYGIYIDEVLDGFDPDVEA